MHILKTFLLLCVCFYFHAGITCVVLAAMPLSLLTSNWFGKRSAVYNQRVKEAGQDVYNALNSIIESMKPIKANRYERQALFLYVKKLIASLRIRIRRAMFTFYTAQFNSIVFGTMIFLLTYFLIRGVVEGTYTLGFFTAYCAYMNMLYKNLQGYGGFYHGVLSSRPAFKRVYELIDDSSKNVGIKGLNDLSDNSVRLDGLSIWTTSSLLLKDVTLQVKPNEVVVICGENGCGKTTLLHTIAGLTKPSSGNVFIGGVELSDIRHYTLKRLFGCMFCDNPFTPQWASLSKDQVSAGEKIMENFNWILEQEPRILVLDEPTVNLDENRRKTMMDMLQSRKGSMTMFITTHYPCFFRNFADAFYWIENQCLIRVSKEDIQ